MTSTSVRFLKALCTGVAATIALAACGSTTTGGGGLASDQTLKFPIIGDFGTLDPGQLNAETDSEVAQNVFNGLLKFDNNLNIVPDIAQSLPTVSSDGLTYTFKLRNDVTFSNGDKVTAKDFLYSWNRAAALQGGYAYLMTPIAGYDKVSQNKKSGAALETLLEAKDPSVWMTGVTAPDGDTGYTIQIKLTASAGYLNSEIALEATTFMVVDVNAVKTDPDNWWTKPQSMIGTGAFKMTAYTPKQSVEFSAVSNWWGTPKPTLTKVHLDILQDAHSAITAYEQGSYDLYGFGGYSNAPIADVLRIQSLANEKDQLLLHPKVRTTWVSFNMVCDASRPAKGPFCPIDSPGAKALRMAFALAIDKTQLASVVCHNIVCSPATGGLITKGLVGYLGDNQDPLAAFDAAQAKTLLKQGDPDGSKTKGLTYTYDPNNPLNKDAAVFLQDQWQTNLGVHVDLQAVDHSAFIKARLKGSYVMSRDGWQADFNHPQDWFDSLWGSAVGCPDANCTSGYATPAYDAATKKADTEAIDQATPDYQNVSKMLIADAAYIPLYYSVGAFFIKPYVKGAGTNNFFDYWWNQYQIQSH
jgi:oligopeptide transport system substrate-binding protein